MCLNISRIYWDYAPDLKQRLPLTLENWEKLFPITGDQKRSVEAKKYKDLPIDSEEGQNFIKLLEGLGVYDLKIRDARTIAADPLGINWSHPI